MSQDNRQSSSKETRDHQRKYEFRLDAFTQELFERQIELQGVTKQELFERWAKEWLKYPGYKPPPPHDPINVNLRNIVARSVADHFVRNSSIWIDDAILDAVRGLGIGSIFGSRFDHYIDEKRFLSKLFAPWLLEHIILLLKSDTPVCLAADSGTSIYFIIEEFTQLLRERCVAVDELANLYLLTNNFAALRCYTEISGLRKLVFQNGRIADLASHIKPHATGGELQIEYAAFVGEDAIASLLRCRATMPNAHIIGLLAANWVRVVASEKRPCPMYRDPLQGAFKKAFIEICDEVFLPVPLGKVFVNHGEATINFEEKTGFRKYTDVSIANKKNPIIKLITTSRVGHCLLERHSQNLIRTIEHAEIKQAVSLPTGPCFAEAIPWVVVPFPDATTWSDDVQLNKEFPHEYARNPKVLEMFEVGDHRR